MKYQQLDMNQYKRKSHFQYFNSLAYPYMGVTINVDITRFLAAVKEKKLPFFLSFCYCVATAANAVPEFRQRICEGGIIEYQNCRTSHTVALEDGTYCYCILDSNMEFQEFIPYAIGAQEDAKEIKQTEDHPEDVKELIFISTLPWLSYTTMVNPVPMPADSNPRITWGKYFEETNRSYLPVTVLCNHALVDGLHISQFYGLLERQLAKMADAVLAI